jgi:hypothetical protein
MDTLLYGVRAFLSITLTYHRKNPWEEIIIAGKERDVDSFNSYFALEIRHSLIFDATEKVPNFCIYI